MATWNAPATRPPTPAPTALPPVGSANACSAFMSYMNTIEPSLRPQTCNLITECTWIENQCTWTGSSGVVTGMPDMGGFTLPTAITLPNGFTLPQAPVTIPQLPGGMTYPPGGHPCDQVNLLSPASSRSSVCTSIAGCAWSGSTCRQTRRQVRQSSQCATFQANINAIPQNLRSSGCNNIAGCSWTGSTCTGSGSFPATIPPYITDYNVPDVSGAQSVLCEQIQANAEYVTQSTLRTQCVSAGCSWNGNTCYSASSAVSPITPPPTFPPPTTPPPTVPLPLPVLTTWNSTACEIQCLCTSGAMPQGRDSCGVCSMDDLTLRQSCCSSCCIRTLYLNLVFSGDLSLYPDPAVQLRPSVIQFITSRSISAGYRIQAYEILNVTFSSGSIHATAELSNSVSSATVQGFSTFLVRQANSGVPLTMLTSVGTTLQMTGVTASNNPPVPSSAASGDDDDEGLSGGVIAGIVIGSLLFCCCLAFMLWYFMVYMPGTSSTASDRQVNNPVYEGSSTPMSVNPLATGSHVGPPGTRQDNPYDTHEKDLPPVSSRNATSSGGMGMDLRNPMRLASAIILGIALVLAIAGTADPSMITVNEVSAGTGVWTWYAPVGSLGTSQNSFTAKGDSCELNFVSSLTIVTGIPAAYQQGCYDALVSKCKTGKAFSILGVLANVAALPLTVFVVPMGTPMLMGLCLFAAFCYMIVFAVWAAMFNADASTDASDASCGFGGKLIDQDAHLGAAFGLMVTAWCLVIIGAVVGFIGGRS